MNEKTKKALSRLYATGLILLAALLTFMTLFPVASFDVSDQSFASGRFTSHAMPLDKVDVGVGTIITIVKEFDDFTTINGIEANDDQIKSLDEKIKEKQESLGAYLESKSDSETDISQDSTYKRYKEEIEELEKQKAETIADNEERLSKLTQEDHDRIKNKLQKDADFVSIIAAFDIFGQIGDALNASVKLSDPLYDMNLTGMILLLFVIILMMVVYPVVMAIILLVKLIQYFINLFKADIEKTEKRMRRFPFFIYPITMLVVIMLFAVMNTVQHVSIGIGVWAAVLVCFLVSVLRGIKAIVCAGKHRVRVVVKQALTVLSVICMIVILMNFSGTFLLEGIRAEHIELNDTYYDALTDAQGENASGIKDTVENTVIWNRILIPMGLMIASVMALTAVISLISRLGYKTTKDKNGNLIDHNGSLLVFAVVVLIIAIIPPIFNAPDHHAKIDSFEKGIYKTCYQEYLEDGTFAKVEYETLKSNQELNVELIDALKEELKTAQGEEADEITAVLAKTEYQLAAIEQEIKDIETKQSKATLCIVMAALFMVIEIFYIFVNKIIRVKEDQVEESAANDAPAEQAPAEEAPAEQTPAEEAPAEQTPAEEAPAEEAPAEETPAEEAPAEEAPAEETPIEE